MRRAGALPVLFISVPRSIFRMIDRLSVHFVHTVRQVEYRLKRARDAMPKVETIDFSKRPAEEQIREKVPQGEQYRFPCMCNSGPTRIDVHLECGLRLWKFCSSEVVDPKLSTRRLLIFRQGMRGSSTKCHHPRPLKNDQVGWLPLWKGNRIR